MRSLSPSKRLGARLRSRARVGAPLSPSKLPTPPNHHHHHHAHRSSPSTPLRLAAAAARRQQQSTKIVTQVSISSHTRLKMQMGDGANGHSQISAANSTLQCPEISTVAALAPRERGGDFRISHRWRAPPPAAPRPGGAVSVPTLVDLSPPLSSDRLLKICGHSLARCAARRGIYIVSVFGPQSYIVLLHAAL